MEFHRCAGPRCSFAMLRYGIAHGFVRDPGRVDPTDRQFGNLSLLVATRGFGGGPPIYDRQPRTPGILARLGKARPVGTTRTVEPLGNAATGHSTWIQTG